jgi:hypothetical protein
MSLVLPIRSCRVVLIRVDKKNNNNKHMLKKQRKRRRKSRMPLFRVSLKGWLTFRRQKMDRSITRKHCVVTSKQESVKKGKSANTVMIFLWDKLRKQTLIFTQIQERKLEKCQIQSLHANISLLP